MEKPPAKAGESSRSADPVAGPSDAPTTGQGSAANQQPQIQVDETRAVTSYANFCRVTGSPEELIMDFALNPHPMGVPQKPIVMDQRIVLNFYTAKRMMAALQLSLQRHEATFGVLETDIQKRVRPTIQSQQQPPKS